MAPFLVAQTLLGRAAQNVGQTSYPIEGRHLLAIGNGEIGTMTALGALAGVALAATVGARATASNALQMLAGGQAMVLVAFVAFALPVGGAPVLWVGAVLVWMGSGLVFPATMTAIGTTSGNPSRSLAVYAVALSIGLFIGPIIESGVLHLVSESLHATFAVLLPLPLAATILAIVGTEVYAVAGPPPLEIPDRAEHTAGEVSPARAAGGSGAAGRPAATRRPSLLRLPAYRLALAIFLTYQAPFSALVAFGGLLAMRADGATTADAELGFAAFYAVSFFIRAAVVRLAPIRHFRTALVVSTLATSGGIAILGTAHDFALFVVGMGVLGAPHGLTMPLASSILAEHVDHAELGRANARVMASTNGGAALVPFLFGWLADAVGYQETFLLVEIPVVAFGLLLVFELTRMRYWSQAYRTTRAGRPDNNPDPSGAGTALPQ